MRKTLILVLTISVLSIAGVSATPSQASKPFLTYCAKIFPSGPNAQPAVLALPNSNGGCQAGFHTLTANAPSNLIADMNALSKAMFQNGLSLGNYQTSVELGGQPCTPGQPGCNH